MDREGWRELAGLADYTIRITADGEMLRERLVERKIKSGTDPEAARRFVEFSDMANVRECLGAHEAGRFEPGPGAGRTV